MLDEEFRVGRAQLRPGEVLVIYLPPDASPEVHELAMKCGHTVKEANPHTPILVMPYELQVDAMPREWAIEKLRGEINRFREALQELEGSE